MEYTEKKIKAVMTQLMNILLGHSEDIHINYWNY